MAYLKFRIKIEKLCICDVFATHHAQKLKEKLDAHNIHLIFVPAGYTADLPNPLDVSFNDFYERDEIKMHIVVCQ